MKKIENLFENIKKRLLIRHEKHDSATALRGLAAIGVFLTHAEWGGLSDYITNNFSAKYFEIWNSFSLLIQMGPTAFFVASGYALTNSIQSRKRTTLEFFLSRHIRLTPLYSITLFLTYTQYGFENAIQFLSRLLYVDYLFPNLYISNPLDVAWTLPIEFWLSILLILILKYIESIKHLLLLLIFLIILQYPLYYVAIKLGANELWSARLLSGYLPSILIGSLIYLLITVLSKIHIQIITLSVAIPSLPMSLEYLFHKSTSPNFIMLLWSSLFLLYFGCHSKPINVPNLFIWLGTICYGIYLLHPMILQVVSQNLMIENRFVILIVSSFILLISSSLTWVFIEMPLIIMGKKIRIKKKKYI